VLVDDGLEGLDERARRSRGRRSSTAGAAGAVARRRRGSCAHGTGERPRLAAGGVERERGRLISRSSSSQSLSWSSSSPPSAEMSTIAAQFATKGKKVRVPSSRSRRLPRPSSSPPPPPPLTPTPTSLPRSQCVAIGRNYAAHIKELNNATPTEPFFFLKPTSSYALSPDGKVEIPRGVVVHHEGPSCSRLASPVIPR